MDSFAEVLVVGARPTSLTRAFAVHARTLEMLDARGLADAHEVRGDLDTEIRV